MLATEKETVLYVEGERAVRTVIKNGMNVYGPETEEELTKKHPAAKKVTWEYAWKKIEKLNKEHYCKPWKEVDEEVYNEYLNCLPPEAWQRGEYREAFRMMEYTTDSITGHTLRLGTRYFYAERPVTISYTPYFEEIKKQFNIK